MDPRPVSEREGPNQALLKLAQLTGVNLAQLTGERGFKPIWSSECSETRRPVPAAEARGS